MEVSCWHLMFDKIQDVVVLHTQFQSIEWLTCFESYMVWWQYDDSKSQELIERKIKNAPDGQGTVRILSREEWEAIREVRPRTPFESKLARPNAQIRTGERLRKVRLFILLYLLYSSFLLGYFVENIAYGHRL